MNAVLAEVLGRNPEQGAYDSLPVAVQQYFTPRQWSFLSDAEKGTVLRTTTEPEA